MKAENEVAFIQQPLPKLVVPEEYFDGRGQMLKKRFLRAIARMVLLDQLREIEVKKNTQCDKKDDKVDN